MAVIKKTLKGLGKVLTQKNSFNNDGGLSSLVIPRQVNGAGAALVIGGGAAIGVANEGFKSHNRAKLGRVRYGNGPARMTSSYTSGAVQAMRRASNGNYAAFADMAEEVVGNASIGGVIENYGATPELISALYNMGGR